MRRATSFSGRSLAAVWKGEQIEWLAGHPHGAAARADQPVIANRSVTWTKPTQRLSASA